MYNKPRAYTRAVMQSVTNYYNSKAALYGANVGMVLPLSTKQQLAHAHLVTVCAIRQLYGYKHNIKLPVVCMQAATKPYSCNNCNNLGCVCTMP